MQIATRLRDQLPALPALVSPSIGDHAVQRASGSSGSHELSSWRFKGWAGLDGILEQGRQEVEQAVSGTIDKELQRLGGLKVRNAEGPMMSDTQNLSLEVGDRPINLTQVLKLSGSVLSGGEAKALIAEGRVRVNGEVELRKRRQMTVGDLVQLEDGPAIHLV